MPVRRRYVLAERDQERPTALIIRERRKNMIFSLCQINLTEISKHRKSLLQITFVFILILRFMETRLFIMKIIPLD